MNQDAVHFSFGGKVGIHNVPPVHRPCVCIPVHRWLVPLLRFLHIPYLQ